MKPKIILTIDLEFWYNSEFLKKYLKNRKNEPQETVESETDKLLAALKEKNAFATFFVVGELAEKYPELIKRIQLNGHEIANHGYSHLALWDMDSLTADLEIKKSTAAIQLITNKPPKIFRAPRYSLSNQTKWLLPILKKYNYTADSSIFPATHILNGGIKVSKKPYNICFDDITKSDSSFPIIEFPISTKNFFGFNLPIGGGIYFRVLPFFIFKLLLKLACKKTAPVIYFHQHELNSKIPNVKAPRLRKKILYWGKKSAFKKFIKLLNNFQCVSINQYQQKYD